MTLKELAAKHGTDKTYYADLYELLLGPRRPDTRTVIEIGIGTPRAMSHMPGYECGASMRMWAEYFPFATIYGYDNDREAVRAINSKLDKRMAAAYLDQGDASSLAYVAAAAPVYDILIDDGSHDPEHQLNTFRAFRHKKMTDGLYIIEDVNGPEVSKALHEMGVEHQQVFTYSKNLGDPIGRCIVIR